MHAPASSVPFAWLSRMRSRAACPRTVSMISVGGLHPQGRHDSRSGGCVIFLAGTGFTVKPLPVRTCFLSPTIVTVNAVGGAGTSCRRAFAVASTSTTAESPESKAAVHHENRNVHVGNDTQRGGSATTNQSFGYVR